MVDAKTETWFPELLASALVMLFAGAATYMWLIGELRQEILIVYIVMVLAAVATVFGVDRLKAVFDLWRK